MGCISLLTADGPHLECADHFTLGCPCYFKLRSHATRSSNSASGMV